MNARSNMMETVYYETSFISYLVAPPSRDLVTAAHQQITREWWEHRRQAFRGVISELVLQEAKAGDARYAALRLSMIAGLPSLEVTSEVGAVARELLGLKVLPAKATADLLHIAIASVHHIHYILTWNFKHLANGHILKKIVPVLDSAGYTCPMICSPDFLLGGTER